MSKNNKQGIKQVPAKEIRIYVYLSLLIFIPLILNWKNISYEFTTSDDSLIITNNYSFLSDFKNVFKVFEKDNFISRTGNNYYRPVQTVSFMIDTQMNGDKLHVYHLSNLIYHILTVIVLFFLLMKLGIRDDISFFLSLLFSVHPLFTDAISWIPGRGDLLAGLFCSLSFLSFIYYNSTKNSWFFLFHAAAFLLALFSKEISVFLPVVLIYYYWLILQNKYKIRALVPFLLVWSLSLFAFFFLRYTYLRSENVLSLNAFINSLPVIPIFLGKLFIPLDLSPLPVYDILFSAFGLLLFAASIIYIKKLRTANNSLIILGAAWFLGFIIPAMFVDLPFSKVHFDYLECRAYLPSIGIFIVLGVIINKIIRRKGINILIKTFIPVILIFAGFSFVYSGDFADADAFFSSIIKSNPDNAYAFSKRGCIYLNRNNYDFALANFDNAIKVSPAYSDPYYNKGLVYQTKNELTNAEHFYAIALNYDTLYPEINSLYENVYINLSSVKYNLKEYIEAIDILKKGIRKYPDNSQLYNNLGLAYYHSAIFDSALYGFNKAIGSDKNISSYYNSRGLVEYHLNRFTDALNDFNSALELKPDLLDGWGNRGMVKIKMNDYDGAIYDLTRAISIKQNLGAAWYYRGVAYSKLNKLTEAESDWAEARKLGFKEVVGEK